jgi:TolA-binding protein
MIHYAVVAGIFTSAPAFSAANSSGSGTSDAGTPVPSPASSGVIISAQSVTGISDIREVLQRFQSVIEQQSRQLEEQRKEIEQQKQQLEVFRNQLDQDAGPPVARRL